MARANDLMDAIGQSTLSAEQSLKLMDEVMMIGIPMPVVRKLSDEAAKRNITFAQLLVSAIDFYLKETQTESTAPATSGPRLLTEG